jgi:hypothetical protein
MLYHRIFYIPRSVLNPALRLNLNHILPLLSIAEHYSHIKYSKSNNH